VSINQSINQSPAFYCGRNSQVTAGHALGFNGLARAKKKRKKKGDLVENAMKIRFAEEEDFEVLAKVSKDGADATCYTADCFIRGGDLQCTGGAENPATDRRYIA
jgi:hypothetical protein